MINSTEALEDIAKQISNADWSFDRSDDYSAYVRGRAQCIALTEKMHSMSFDQDDITFLENLIIDVNPKWSEDLQKEYVDYWSRKINYLTRRPSNGI